MIAPIANVILFGQRFSNARAGAITFAPTLIVIDERMTSTPPISTTTVGNFSSSSTGFHSGFP